MNVGMIDRIVRLVIGIALIVIGILMLKDVWMWVLVVVGAIIAITGLIGWCGLYTICGANTNAPKTKA
jgi:hypothetical protein